MPDRSVSSASGDKVTALNGFTSFVNRFGVGMLVVLAEVRWTSLVVGRLTAYIAIPRTTHSVTTMTTIVAVTHFFSPESLIPYFEVLLSSGMVAFKF